MTRYHAFTVRAGEELFEADRGVDNSKIEKTPRIWATIFCPPPGKSQITPRLDAPDPGYDGGIIPSLKIEKVTPCCDGDHLGTFTHTDTHKVPAYTKHSHMT